ncbi:hypothetical protein PZA11_006200 [Diplocarpon coronariae]
MAKEFTARRREYIHELHERYGPVVRLGPNEVSFTSLEALKEIYTSGGSGYDKTEFYTLFTQFGVSQKKRHIAGPYANTNILRPQVIGGIRERANAFVKKCTEARGKSLDAYVSLIQDVSPVPLIKEENLAKYRWPKLSSWVERILKPRPSQIANTHVLNASEKMDLGEYTLLYKLQHSKDSFQRIEAAAECMDHLAAGIDTTGDVLTFLMYQLSLPESFDIQDRLIQEVGANKDKKLDELPYLHAVIKESLRYFPPIPMSQPRYVPAGGRIIHGYFIAAGTIVSCQAHSVHRLNESVFEKGHEFIPERWLNADKVADMNRLFFAFGLGGRGCTGRE